MSSFEALRKACSAEFHAICEVAEVLAEKRPPSTGRMTRPRPYGGSRPNARTVIRQRRTPG